MNPKQKQKPESWPGNPHRRIPVTASYRLPPGGGDPGSTASQCWTRKQPRSQMQTAGAEISGQFYDCRFRPGLREARHWHITHAMIAKQITWQTRCQTHQSFVLVNNNTPAPPRQLHSCCTQSRPPIAHSLAISQSRLSLSTYH